VVSRLIHVPAPPNHPGVTVIEEVDAALFTLKTPAGLSDIQFVLLVKKLIAEGKIADIGAETAPNYEKIMSLKPDVIFAYGISGNDNTYIEKLRHLGLRVIPINDYLERTPLAKMEYFKFFGLVTGTEHAADSIFASRANEYVKIKNYCAKELADRHIKKTKILLNMPFKGIWYIPGGKNYTSNLIKDAGGEILGSVNQEREFYIMSKFTKTESTQAIWDALSDSAYDNGETYTLAIEPEIYTEDNETFIYLNLVVIERSTRAIYSHRRGKHRIRSV
jgi:ABC-type Fe3+-hydroxamate transport system substrate-binding protein